MPLVKSLTSCHYLKENVKGCVCLCLCSSQWGTGAQEPQLVVGTAGEVVKDVGSSQNERRVHSQSFPTYPGPKWVSFPSLAHPSEANVSISTSQKEQWRSPASSPAIDPQLSYPSIPPPPILSLSGSQLHSESGQMASEGPPSCEALDPCLASAKYS